ncbi:MAG: hypothetical protein SOY49_04770 [Prevotella sp.]|nr:hypothetical protein [Prevotella sp.]
MKNSNKTASFRAEKQMTAARAKVFIRCRPEQVRNGQESGRDGG